ncbi:uncharacterized protein LOC122989106 isoform X1 [Scomber scombrus]|uniref:Uncharacterized protein LOC122989106 isoform X1 n=1 Tax=Scomber scombrus TaxID=13677 RepID=A0AAV1PJQ5_SCOSC
MTAVVKTLIPARPVGKDSFLSTNIPFLDRNNPKAFSTSFKEHFQPVCSKKADPVSHPSPAQVDHKDLRYIKEYLTEAMVSYQRHPLPQITRTPSWAKLYTNFKMQRDHGEVGFLTTQSQTFQPRPFQPPSASIQPSLAIKTMQQVEQFPESIQKDSYPPKNGSPPIKPTVKHLVEGFPTIKGDRRESGFLSHYNNTFQGAWSRPVQPVEKHSSSVAMGNPEKIVERETTHAVSFSQPTVCRPPVMKERLKLNLGNFSKDPWSSTARETFCYHKLEDPVVLTRRDRNFSSVPEGDTDMGRNKERMSVTTNRNSFSNNHTQLPVHVTGADMMTKSNVQFSPPRLSGLYYTTTTTEHYFKRDGERPKPATQLPSNILSGPVEHGVNFSTTDIDFLPKKTCREAPFPSQQRSNIRLPLGHQHYSTTHREAYTAKPLILQPDGCKQLSSHIVMQ